MLKAMAEGARGAVRLLRSSTARANAVAEARRLVRGEPSLPVPAPRRVLVLCHGNLCRSPFAAALLARDPELDVRSGGLGAADGHDADAMAMRVASRFDVDLRPHRTHPVAAADVAWAELVLGMEGSHAVALRRRFPDASPRLRLLGDFLDEAPHRIDDPWGRSDAFFDHTFRRIERAVTLLRRRLEALRASARETRHAGDGR